MIRIPFDDDKLKSDIRAIRKEVTASGNVRFAADRGTNGHADRFWGLALALHAAKTTSAPVEFESMGEPDGRGRRYAG